MTKDEVLHILKENTDFVSGQYISSSLNISRTAVWKAVSSLRNEGYNIESVTNKGYRLLKSPDRLDTKELKDALVSTNILKAIEYKKSTDSTNALARDAAEERGEFEGKAGKMPALFIADEQSAGRGRLGRSWISNSTSGIWMSLLIKPDIEVVHAPIITILAAIAVCEAINNNYDIKAYIKWPNDIVVDGKKLCGILTEMSADLDGIKYIVTGIGINIKKENLPGELDGRVAALEQVTGKKTDRERLIIDIIERLIKLIDKIGQSGELGSLKDRYEKLCINMGREVNVLDPKGEYRARAVGIDNKGELIVECKDKSIKKVLSGEVSVRGVYGYV